jgi:hypothetical protein
MMRRTLPAAAVLIAVIATTIYSQRMRPQIVGPSGDGGFVLNTGWRIRLSPVDRGIFCPVAACLPF